MNKNFMLLLLSILAALLLASCTHTFPPQAGAVFTGKIAIGDLASSAGISFNITDDGSTIENLTISLADLDCNYLKAELMSGAVYVGIPVADGSFSASLPVLGNTFSNFETKVPPQDLPEISEGRPGQFSGKFTSPTQASGSIHLYITVPMWGKFELGTFDWEAEGD